MKRGVFMLILLVIAFPAAASSWSSLWFNPDQRAEKLLQQGDASAAAKLYKNPKRKAYAEMKAGNFKQAASDLNHLHDNESDYNRGNALAKMGDLKGALDAYDAVLKIDPHNRDARHNRDLVTNAMKKKSPPPKSANNQQQNGKKKGGKSGGKQGNKQGSNSKGQGKQAGQSGNGQSGKNGQPSHSPENKSAQSGKNANNPAGENSAAHQSTPQGASGNKAQKDDEQHNGNTNSARQKQVPDDAAQARQDAAASLGHAGKNKQDATGTGGANRVVPSPAQTPPMSEQQLSKKQWLRSIPNDPGGLLRRKFMIEYMLRQQKAQQ